MKIKSPKTVLFIVLAISLAIFCGRRNRTWFALRSPSGLYAINCVPEEAISPPADKHIIVINLFDQKDSLISSIDTRVSDLHKWEVKWSTYGDTIESKSSDIGSRRWAIHDGTVRALAR